MLFEDLVNRRRPKQFHVTSLTDYSMSKAQFDHGNTTILFDTLPVPTMGNIWHSRDAIASELNTKVDDIPKLILKAVEQPARLAHFRELSELYTLSQLKISDLPAPKYYPFDGGRYITAGIVSVSYKKKENLSFHRLMILNDKSAAIRLVERHLYSMYTDSLKDKAPLKVAVVIGAPLPFLIAGAISFEYERSEIDVANALNYLAYGKEMEFTKVDGITVPADAGMVLYGTLTDRMVKEGPFCDIMLSYDSVRDQPVVEIDKIYLSKSPFFHSILPGGMEHVMLMGIPREAGIYRTVNSVVPHVRAVRLTEGSGGWLHGVVSIKKVKEGDGKNAIMAAFTGHPSMKQVTVVDDDINIFNDREVEWAMATRFQADNGIVLISNAAGSSLDHSTKFAGGLTSKLGFDATLPVADKTAMERDALNPFRMERL